MLEYIKGFLWTMAIMSILSLFFNMDPPIFVIAAALVTSLL